jgi:xanthine dehydrogenase molybdenum-binding subunit
MVVLNLDGTVNVVSGAAEVGPGERTLMAMIASETLGIPFNKVSIAYDVDSDISPDTGVTAGSRQTNSGGWGVHQAALDARAQLMSWAARKFVADARARRQTIDVKPEQLELVGDGVQFIDDPSRKLKLTEVVAFSTAPIIGRGAVPYDTTWERLAFASHAAEIELDTLTGSVKVLGYVAAHDVGRALNPFAVSQQIEGGVIMGIGAALTESMLTDNGTGVPLNPNLLDYRALSILDVPKTIDVIMVERPKEYGVYGAHGIGEPPIALAGSVISNAIYNAVGVWMTDLPMNRARILAALRSAV